MVQNYDIECKKVTPLVQGRYFCSNCTMTINGETVKGFNMIMDGKVDQYPESAFMLVGTIEDAIEKGEKILAQSE